MTEQQNKIDALLSKYEEITPLGSASTTTNNNGETIFGDSEGIIINPATYEFWDNCWGPF